MLEAMGGYFELELSSGRQLYPHAKCYNSARSAFKSLLLQTQPTRVYLPYYICDVMQEVLQDTPIEILRYALSPSLELLELPKLSTGELLLYVDYFGLKSTYVEAVLAPYYGTRLIVDNSQALFSPPLPGIATLYSPRKFVGVADGGWLVNGPDPITLPRSSSQQRFSALLGRLEDQPQPHYDAFQRAEHALRQEGVRAMSRSTERLLDSIDYPHVARRRIDNLSYLRTRLDRHNRFNEWPQAPVAALCYPLLVDSAETANRLREQLLAQHIYVPRYWVEVDLAEQAPTNERNWANCLLPLPIDQRYDITHMHRLLSIVITALEGR
ncbi:hypothetical protein D3C77_169550 [compost metagenome]